MLNFSELGHGAQFKAYDMNNGKVLKIPLTEAETKQVALKRRNIIHGTSDKLASIEMRVQTFMNSKARIPAMVNHNLDDSTQFMKILGHPKIIPAGDFLPEDTEEKRWSPARFVYTQDRAEMGKTILKSVNKLSKLTKNDINRLRRYIEDFIQVTYDAWTFGYSDYIFKLGDSGIDKNGNLILVDLGEWTSDLDFVKRSINEQWWRDNLNPKKIDFPKLPRQLEEFYAKTLSASLTEDELTRRWRHKHICGDCVGETATIAAFVSTKATEIDYIDRL